MSIKPVILSAVAALFATQSALAATIIKIDLGGTGPNVSYSAGVFGTTDDGNGSTTGNQDTSVNYVGDLGFFTDILNDASFTLGGVAAVGNALLGIGSFSQATTGGTFSLFAADNSLLLLGALDGGAITGGLASTTGSFFTTNVASFTGGSLLAYIANTPAALSIALTGASSSGVAGFNVVCPDGCTLNPFSADATGEIEGAPVPEPATMALLFGGLLTAAGIRRRAA